MLSNFKALILIVSLFSSVFVLSFILNNNVLNPRFIEIYMSIIFIIFGLLKLYDITTFSTIFSKYDIIANTFNIYGYIYPFIELFLGIGFYLGYYINVILYITISLMTISLISVLISIAQNKVLRCGCLGSFFHIPLSYVTISENLVMIFMSIKHLLNLPPFMY
jgi:hypothetical protein